MERFTLAQSRTYFEGQIGSLLMLDQNARVRGRRDNNGLNRTIVEAVMTYTNGNSGARELDHDNCSMIARRSDTVLHVSNERKG